MLRIVLLAGLLLSSSIGYSSERRPNPDKVSRLVKRMERQKYLMHNYKITARNVRYANQLNQFATDEELVNLTKHPHHVPFCLAFLILSKRNSPTADSIYQAFISPILAAVERGEKTFHAREINTITKSHPSCILVLMNDLSFLEEVKLQGKYLELIK